MKKKTKKLKLAKETVRSLEDGLRHVNGGAEVTVVSGCNFCVDASEGSCCSCIDGCA